MLSIAYLDVGNGAAMRAGVGLAVVYLILTPASALVRDVYQKNINPRASDRQVLLYTRLCVVARGAGA